MKKTLFALLLIFSMIFSFSACKNSKSDDSSIDLPFETIAKCNSRTTLLEKYKSITETTYYKSPIESDIVPDWSFSCEKNSNGDYNAALVYGDEYSEYYYNMNIFTSSGNEVYSKVLPYKEDYESLVKRILQRDNTLNYAYITSKEAYKTDNGYVAVYNFKATSDILSEFKYWDVKPNDNLRIVYKLNKDMEITEYSYFHIVENNATEIANVVIEFSKPFEVPEKIKELDETTKYNKLTLVQYADQSNEYSQSFMIPDGCHAYPNEFLTKYNIYKDKNYTDHWYYDVDKVTTDTTLYIK